jgi:hypothetical protein
MIEKDWDESIVKQVEIDLNFRLKAPGTWRRSIKSSQPAGKLELVGIDHSKPARLKCTL